MSSARSAAQLTLELVPSRILLAGLAVCHLLALISLLICDLPVSITLSLGMLIAFSLVLNYARYGHRHSRWFVERVACLADGNWALQTADGRHHMAQLLDSSYVHPRLVILNFALGTFARRSVVLLPDSTDANDLRRLRVRLLTRNEDEDADAGSV